MQGGSEQTRMSSRRSRAEKGGSEESRKPGASPGLLWRCELRTAAKQIVLRKTGRRGQAGCGMPLGGVKIYNKGAATEEKKDSFKNSAEA